jgi:hypothetical protein
MNIHTLTKPSLSGSSWLALYPSIRQGSSNIASTLSLLWFACVPVRVRIASHVTCNLATSCLTLLSQGRNRTSTLTEFVWPWCGLVFSKYSIPTTAGLPSILTEDCYDFPVQNAEKLLRNKLKLCPVPYLMTYNLIRHYLASKNKKKKV